MGTGGWERDHRPHTIAIVEHDEDIRDLLAEVLTEAGYQTMVLCEGSHAFARICQERPDATILDIHLQRPRKGWTLLDLLRLDRKTEGVFINDINDDRCQYGGMN